MRACTRMPIFASRSTERTSPPPTIVPTMTIRRSALLLQLGPGHCFKPTAPGIADIAYPSRYHVPLLLLAAASRAAFCIILHVTVWLLHDSMDKSCVSVTSHFSDKGVLLLAGARSHWLRMASQSGPPWPDASTNRQISSGSCSIFHGPLPS